MKGDDEKENEGKRAMEKRRRTERAWDVPTGAERWSFVLLGGEEGGRRGGRVQARGGRRERGRGGDQAERRTRRVAKRRQSEGVGTRPGSRPVEDGFKSKREGDRTNEEWGRVGKQSRRGDVAGGEEKPRGMGEKKSREAKGQVVQRHDVLRTGRRQRGGGSAA